MMIPVNEPLVGEKELEYICRALKTGWISSEGEFIREFEKGFAHYTGRRYAVAVNNGTNALILAVKAMDFPPESEVIIPTFTIISCAIACIYNELIPVFVDSEKDTWNMDTAALEEKINPRTKAIMAVHIYGHPVDMENVERIARKYRLDVIEDFAEAIGSEYRGKRCGGFGKISCVSFYANKTITTGEGGMCLTDDEELAERLGRLRNLAFVPENRFVHHELGFNFRMTNIQAAIGLAQLERIEEHVVKKIHVGKRYSELLGELEKNGMIRLPVEREWARNTYWMYGLVLNENLRMDAREAMNRMLAKGVQTRSFFYPMNLQPAFEKYPWFKKESLPVSEKLYQYGFYLPSGLTLTQQQITKVCESVKEVIS